MIQYIYFVKCPDCEDEHFDFFNDAKDFALGCLSKKPIITQTEVNRNDFGECIDSSDLGTIWSWEDIVGSTDDEPALSIFTKDDLKTLPAESDPEFDALDNSLDDIPDNFRKPITENADRDAEMRNLAKEMFDLGVECSSYEEFVGFMKENDDVPTKELYAIYRDAIKDHVNSAKGKAIPEGMTIEQLVEEMEENEDEVECTWCNELFDKSECRKEVDLGWLCSRCEAAIKSRGEPLTFQENSYWDFLDESAEDMLNVKWAANNCGPVVKQMIADDLICAVSAEKVVDRRNRFAQKTGRCPICAGTLDDMICDNCGNSFRQNGCNGYNTKLIDALLIRSIEQMDPKFKTLSIDDKVEYIFNAYFGNPNEAGNDTIKRVNRENNRNKILGGAGYDDSANRVRATKQKIKQELLLVYKRETEINDALAKIKPEDYLKEDVYAYAKDSIDSFGVDKSPVDEDFVKEDVYSHTAADFSFGLDKSRVDESFGSEEVIEFDYTDLKVTLQGPKRDVDDWDEAERVVDFTYTKNKDDVVMDVWDWFITEEDAKDVPGGLETLNDDAEWTKFLEANWDTLLDKYYSKLLDYYRPAAAEEYESTHSLDEATEVKECGNTTSFLEELEESESYSKRLIQCPECDTKYFDPETGICINCGFI